MSESRSRFGINLLIQLVAAGLLSYYSSRLPLAFRETASTIQTFLYSSFTFGVIYGFFRLCGSKGGVFEWYYQHVPIGFLRSISSKQSQVTTPPTSAPSSSYVDDNSSTAGPTFQVQEWTWDQLLTPRYIRYAGVLLIVSAIFSFFFRIQWDALEKIIAADIAALILIAAAEFSYRRRWEVLSSISFLVSYAMFQFSLTLMFSLLQEDPLAPLAHIELWLSLKVVTMILGLPLLKRYASEYSAIVYVCISYSDPLMVYHAVPMIDPATGLLWTICISLVTLFLAVQSQRYELSPLNAVLASAHAMIFYGASVHGLVPVPTRAVAAVTFGTLIALYLMQIGADVLHHLKKRDLDEGMLGVSTVVSHVVSALTLAVVQPSIPSLADYQGLTWLGLSLVGFLTCFSFERIGIRNRYAEVLLNIALTLSALGLFFQTKGTWTAVVFLLYSCVVLYASLLSATKTTRIFAFLVLTLSLLKLYLECAQLFDTLSGSIAVFVIGCLLLVLSNRFDSVKRLMSEPNPPSSDARTENRPPE